jgi:hypothetical protein
MESSTGNVIHLGMAGTREIMSLGNLASTSRIHSDISAEMTRYDREDIKWLERFQNKHCLNDPDHVHLFEERRHSASIVRDRLQKKLAAKQAQTQKDK